MCHSTIDLSKIKFSIESLRLTVGLVEQKNALLALNVELCEKEVEITQPWSLERPTSQQHANATEQVGDVNVTTAESHLYVMYGVLDDCAPNKVATECISGLSVYHLLILMLIKSLVLSWHPLKTLHPHIIVAVFLRLRVRQ